MSIYKENAGYHFLLFAISPFLGMVYAIKTRSKQVIRWSIFAFTVIYGSLFHKSFLGDGAVHWQAVYDNYQYLSFEVWWNRLLAILRLDPTYYTNDDPYIHVISYIVGSLFNVPGLFFVAVALVYAYFFSGAIVKLLSYVRWDLKYNKFYFLFFLTLLILWEAPYLMQTVRTWTGMWVLIYAVISYYETKKSKYLLLALTPPLIHVGYFVMAVPAWIVLFTGFRNPKVYFIIFVLSIFFSNVVEQSGFTEQISQTELGASKTKSYYTGDDKAGEGYEGNREKLAQNENFYKVFERYKLHINVLSGMVIFIYLFLRGSGFGKIENLLFSCGLSFASMANFFTQIFAVHNRLWNISVVFILCLVLIFLSKNKLRYMRFSFLKVRLPLTVFTIAIVPYMLYLISINLSYTSPYLFVLPIAHWIKPEEAGMSLRQLIGLFL